MARVTCYGGVGRIGGNKLRLDAGDTSVFLDFGLAFGAEGQFYEEFLQPRSTAKLRDLLALDLVPSLDGLYRRDALQPDGLDRVADDGARALWETDIQSYEAAEAAGDWTPDALFLSHAHLDHAGYIPYLGNVPIHCSNTTRTVLEALAAVGNLGGFDGELLELKRREVDELGGRSYFPGASKLSRADPEPRDYRMLDPGDRNQVGNVEMEAFDVGHSIPGATAGLLEGDGVQVLYTGDIRFHGRSGGDLGEDLRGLRPDLMLCEGTRITEDEPDDEKGVEDDLAAVFRETEGLAMVGFAWKDLERYETVRRAAERADRIPVFDPRLAYLAAQLGDSIYDEGASVFVERSGGMLYSPGDYTRAKHKLGERPISEWDSRDGITDTIHLERGTTAAEVRADPSRYVLHLDYYRFKNLPDLDPPEGSTFVRAQTEPFNEGMELSEERLINWLAHFSINADRDNEPIQIHASGHACGTEIQAMIDAIEPEVLVPIHTEHPEAFENEAGEVVRPEEGVPIEV